MADVNVELRLTCPGSRGPVGHRTRSFAERAVDWRSVMKPLSRAVSSSLALVVMTGCASTEVTERQRYERAKLARPDRIIVHDFTANPAEVPSGSALPLRWRAWAS